MTLPNGPGKPRNYLRAKDCGLKLFTLTQIINANISSLKTCLYLTIARMCCIENWVFKEEIFASIN